MSYNARILADSINACGVRLTTFEVTLPRIVLAEFNTHRMLSRNSASSRAIPIEKRIAAVRSDPFVPEFSANKAGMQPGEVLDGRDQDDAAFCWLEARDHACSMAEELAQIGVHKQWANRLIEPFCWHTIIASATEWQNFFSLRCHPDAQAEIRRAAEIMRALYQKSEPVYLGFGEWHLPLVREVDQQELIAAGYVGTALAEISAGRCARVSYLTHDGRRAPDEDIGLYRRLVASGHMSPLEHPACVVGSSYVGGNFGAGWRQLRKTIPGEAIFDGGRT